MHNVKGYRKVRLRLAKVKKGCFGVFMANEDEKEEKTIKIKKEGEPAKQDEQ